MVNPHICWRLHLYCRPLQTSCNGARRTIIKCAFFIAPRNSIPSTQPYVLHHNEVLFLFLRPLHDIFIFCSMQTISICLHSQINSKICHFSDLNISLFFWLSHRIPTHARTTDSCHVLGHWMSRLRPRGYSNKPMCPAPLASLATPSFKYPRYVCMHSCNAIKLHLYAYTTFEDHSKLTKMGSNLFYNWDDNWRTIH